MYVLNAGHAKKSVVLLLCISFSGQLSHMSMKMMYEMFLQNKYYIKGYCIISPHLRIRPEIESGVPVLRL